MALKNYYIGRVNIFKGGKSEASKTAKKRWDKYVITKVTPYAGSIHLYDIYGHEKGSKVRG